MQRFAFKMFLHPGQRDAYRRRHDEIWPELSALLTAAGIRNYSIFLDDDTNILFAYLERTDDHRMADLPNEAVMRADGRCRLLCVRLAIGSAQAESAVHEQAFPAPERS